MSCIYPSGQHEHFPHDHLKTDFDLFLQTVSATTNLQREVRSSGPPTMDGSRFTEKYASMSYSFVKFCDGVRPTSQDLNELFLPMSQNTNGCPILFSSLMQNVVLSHHNASDKTHPMVVGSGPDIDSLCNLQKPVWHSISVEMAEAGTGDLTVYIPSSPHFSESDIMAVRTEVCGVTFLQQSLRLSGKCSIAREGLSKVKLCSEGQDGDIGIYMRDFLSHSEYKPDFSIFALYNLFVQNSTSKVNQREGKAVWRGTLAKDTCKTLSLSQNADSWLTNTYVKCGGSERLFIQKHTISSKCSEKFMSKPGSFLCQHYFSLKIICSFILFLLALQISNKIANTWVLFPLAVAVKPLEWLLLINPKVCKYCQIPLYSPWHECSRQCMCGYISPSGGSMPEHDCTSKSISNTEQVEDNDAAIDLLSLDGKPAENYVEPRLVPLPAILSVRTQSMSDFMGGQKLATISSNLGLKTRTQGNSQFSPSTSNKRLQVDEGVVSGSLYPDLDSSTESNQKPIKAKRAFIRIKRNSFNNPLNAILRKICFSVILCILFSELTPSSMAISFEATSGVETVCNATGMYLKKLPTVDFQVLIRSVYFNEKLCNSNENVMLFLMSNCLLLPSFINNVTEWKAYAGGETYTNDLHAINYIMNNSPSGIVQSFLIKEGPRINQVDDRVYCTKLAEFLIKTNLMHQNRFHEDDDKEDINKIRSDTLIGETHLSDLNLSDLPLNFLDSDYPVNYTEKEKALLVKMNFEYLFYYRMMLDNSNDPKLFANQIDKLNQQKLDLVGDLSTDNVSIQYLDIDSFQKQIFDTFKPSPNEELPLAHIPLHFEATQGEEPIVHFKINAVPLEASNYQLADPTGLLPISIMVFVKNTRLVYPLSFLYTTSPVDKAEVYSSYRCVDTCNTCYDDLKDSPGYQKKYAKCWENVNSWLCEGKGCWTINTGSVCAYCTSKPTQEQTDVYRLGKPKAVATVCISINGKLGCKNFETRNLITQKWGQLDASFNSDQSPYAIDTLVAHELKTGIIYTGDILGYRQSGKSFGLPQYKNGTIMHEEPELDMSFECFNQDRFDLQVSSCTRSTYNQLASLSQSSLHFGGSSAFLDGADVGDLTLLLKVPVSHYNWYEATEIVSLTIKRVQGCTRCEKKGLLLLQAISKYSGHAILKCQGFILEHNAIVVGPNRTRINSFPGYLTIAHDEKVNCSILTKNGNELANADYNVKKSDIELGYTPELEQVKIESVLQHHLTTTNALIAPNLPFFTKILNVFHQVKIVLYGAAVCLIFFVLVYLYKLKSLFPRFTSIISYDNEKLD